jgi:hypothetical protein
MAQATPPSTDDTAPSATADVLTTNRTEYNDRLYGTDRAAARGVIEAARHFTKTDLDTVEVERFGRWLNVELSGTVVVSSQQLEKHLRDGYSVDSWLAFHNGDVEVTLVHDSDQR